VTRATLHPCAWRRDTRARRWLPPRSGAQEQALHELEGWSRERNPAGGYRTGPRQREDCAHRIVEAGLGDNGLGHLGSQADIVEERYQDGRVRYGEDCAYHEGYREGYPEDGGDGQGYYDRGQRPPPGRMSNPRPKAVREITRSEIPVPPWNRIRETLMVRTSYPSTPSKGFSTSPKTEGPIRAPPRRALPSRTA